MISKTLVLSSHTEMDARRLALLVQSAGAFESDIYLMSGKRRINAKSLMGTMALRMTGGESITITAEGPDEAAAVEKLTEFLED